MGGFLTFITEQNEIGLDFEKATAKNINRWLSKNKMSDLFKAERFKPAAGQRSENFPDVIVYGKNDRFFVECKQYSRANMVNARFDFDENCKARSNDGKYEDIADRINESVQFKKFQEFMTSEQKLLKGMRPIDVYFGRNEFDPKKLIPKYNRLVRNGLTESDCKEFDLDNIRKSTAGIMSCAIAWRLANKSTWDICKIKIDLKPYLIKKYGEGVRVKYLQLGENLFIINKSDNPLSLDAPALPEKITGAFTVRFTPRFGVGGMYVTPRSEITDRLVSSADFNCSSKWPAVIGK